MKTKSKLILSVTLLLCCSISIFAQSSSSNYQLHQYGFIGGNPNQAEPLASANYKITGSAINGITNDVASSGSYGFYAGYYLGPIEETPILPPESVVITVQNDSIRITWNAVIEATSYSIYSSTDPYVSPEIWTLEEEGIIGTNWSEPISGIPGTKKFYYVKTVK